MEINGACCHSSAASAVAASVDPFPVVAGIPASVDSSLPAAGIVAAGTPVPAAGIAVAASASSHHFFSYNLQNVSHDQCGKTMI